MKLTEQRVLDQVGEQRCLEPCRSCGYAYCVNGVPRAHEAACPIAVCQRMMAPLQARCDGLQAQNQQLQQRVAALEPLQAQNQAVVVQVEGCKALRNVCYGTDAAGLTRKQRVAGAGGRGAAAAALQAHPGDANVQRLGQWVIDNILE